MTTWEENWIELYATQTETLADSSTGFDGKVYATIGGVLQSGELVGGVTGRCVLGIDGRTPELQLSDFTESGNFSFQMLRRDFAEDPLPQCPIIVNGVTGLYAANVNANNGVLYFTAQDPNKE